MVYVVNKIGIRKAYKRTPKTIAPLGKSRSWLDRTELKKLEEHGIELGARGTGVKSSLVPLVWLTAGGRKALFATDAASAGA